MKSIVTLAATAALIAGVSLANAQGTMGTQKNGATNAASGNNAAYCLDARGAKNCKYPTLAACQKDASSGGNCIKNPASASTNNGLKSNAMEPKGSMKGDMKSNATGKDKLDTPANKKQ